MKIAVLGVFKKIEIPIFSKKKKCFAYISATKYCSKEILYAKRTAEYPLLPHYMDTKLTNKATQNPYVEHFEKNTNCLVYGAYPRNKKMLFFLQF